MKKYLYLAMVGCAGLLGYSVGISGPDEGAPRVSEEQGVVHAGFNTEVPADSSVIEGSVSFMVNVPFATIRRHFQDHGTLGRISPQVEEYTSRQVSRDADTTVYAISEKIRPLRNPVVALPTTRLHLKVTINNRALEKGIIAVDYELDPDKSTENAASPWERMSGRLYALNLRNGWTQVMLATTTKSRYNYATPGIRLTLVRRALGATRNNILAWVDNLSAAAPTTSTSTSHSGSVVVLGTSSPEVRE
jgi:hypothetical protein